jgi:hypothetical protein
LYRGVNEFKKEYQPRINIIKDENGNLLPHPQNILNMWKNFFIQVLSVHGFHDVRQMDIHTAEPLVPEPSLVEVEIAIGKLKSYKSRVLIRFRPIRSKQRVEHYVLRYKNLFALSACISNYLYIIRSFMYLSMHLSTCLSFTFIADRSRDSSFGIATGYGLNDRVFGVRFPAGAGIFLDTISRPALGPTQPPIRWVLRALSLSIKRPGRESDHSHLVPRSKNEWSYTSTPQYVFMAWWLVKPRDDFTLYGVRKNCHSSRKNLLLHQFIKRVIRPTNNYRGTSLLSTAIRENAETLLEKSMDTGLEINAEKTKYVIMSRHPNSRLDQNIWIANESSENVAKFKYLGTTLANKNDIHDEITSRLNSRNTCYYSVQNPFSSRLIKKLRIKIYKVVIFQLYSMGAKLGL